MSEGITHDCVMLWRTVATKGGWWSALRLAREWSPTFALAEVQRHLATLRKGGFLQEQDHPRMGAVYAFTGLCSPLPGESGHVPRPQDEAPCTPATPEARRPDVMHTHYRPPQPAYRAGALNHLQYPSLQMGRRVPAMPPTMRAAIQAKKGEQP